MKELKSNLELIAYASAFVSFILPKVKGFGDIKEIILFGSVAREEADKHSDIDLFFNIEDKNKEKELKGIIDGELQKFYKSQIAEVFILKGIKNPIKIQIGELEEWKLKRSIISEGIGLYGRYKVLPSELIKFIYFNIEPIKDISKRNRVIRRLFGRREIDYSSKGIIEIGKGRRLTPTSFIVSGEYLNEIIDFLGKEKINYKFFELWTDQVS